MKLCKDCQYFSGSMYCKSPSNGVSLVSGEPNACFASWNRLQDVLALASSDTNDYCGPEGKHFVEKKIEEKKPWYRRIW